MKKISAFFLSIFLMALLSCAPEEDTKTIIITPPELMSAVTCSIPSGKITANDKIGLNAPQNATDATLYYEIAVGADCKTPTEGSSKKYTGEITLSSAGLNPGDDDFITLKVLAVKKGFENGVWTLRWRFSDGSVPVLNDDAFLKSVSASNNEANIVLLPNVFVYDEISVPNDVEKISINYEKSNKDATVETYPASLKDIPLTAGRTTLITFTVTSSNKSTTKRYSFNIYRASKEEPPFKSTDCFLSNLLVKGDTLIAFDKNKENYKASVANSVATTSVTYLLSSNKAQVTTTPASLENISLTAGQTTDVSIKVTAEDPNYTKTYKVSIYREPAGSFSADATLKALSVTGGSLSFSPATKDYEVTIPSSYAGAVSVAYEENHIGATVTTIPNDLNNISIAPGATETVTILVTAENKVATETYTVKIKRDSVNLDGNANLSNIALSAGSLSFDKDTTSYTVNVDASVANVTVTATTESDKAKVTYIPSQTVAPQKGGSETVTINVTAEDGTPKTYTVIVNRAGDDNPPPPPVAGDYYWTNKDGAVGINKTITIDGDASDWSENMKIAQGAAWDVANHWKGGHENCVLDTVGLYAAWDDTNLYVAWQMVNTTDTWAREGDGPLSDGGRVLDVPLILALSVDSSKVKMSNKTTNGSFIWGNKGLEFTTHVDNLLYMSGKAGLGTPSLFKAVDANGNTNYEEGCLGFKENNISYKMAETNINSTIWGLNSSDDPSDVNNPDADWVDYKVFAGASGTHKTTYDSFYEISIPLSVLGITKAQLESKGIGAMLVATRGESALDCIPFDSAAMLDNATGNYGSDPSTSHEKDDVDNITVSLARIGKM